MEQSLFLKGRHEVPALLVAPLTEALEDPMTVACLLNGLVSSLGDDRIDLRQPLAEAERLDIPLAAALTDEGHEFLKGGIVKLKLTLPSGVLSTSEAVVAEADVNAEIKSIHIHI